VTEQSRCEDPPTGHLDSLYSTQNSLYCGRYVQRVGEHIPSHPHDDAPDSTPRGRISISMHVRPHRTDRMKRDLFPRERRLRGAMSSWRALLRSYRCAAVSNPFPSQSLHCLEMAYNLTVVPSSWSSGCGSSRPA
jgi:hypothetical protein